MIIFECHHHFLHFPRFWNPRWGSLVVSQIMIPVFWFLSLHLKRPLINQVNAKSRNDWCLIEYTHKKRIDASPANSAASHIFTHTFCWQFNRSLVFGPWYQAQHIDIYKYYFVYFWRLFLLTENAYVRQTDGSWMEIRPCLWSHLTGLWRICKL